jgi:phosphohistidine swiveling domain-containing protein
MTIAEESRPPGDFPITWEEATDPEVTWEWDDMHMPFALAPLAADYVRVLGLGFNQCYEIFGDFPQRWLCRVWNGYAYFGHRHNVPEADREALSARWLQVMRARADVTEAYWEDEVLPEIKAIDTRLRTVPVETLGAPELAAAWDEAWELAARLWQIHFNLILGPYTILEELADFYEALVSGAAPGESLRLIQGAEHELFATEVGMERLAESAVANPPVHDLLVEATGGEEAAHRAVRIEEIAELDGGPAFLDELDDFLDEHGHMGQAFDDLAMASWAEDPAIVLGELGRRLAHPPEPAETRRLRLAADADALADAVRARLADRPDELERFESLLALSRAIGPLTEVHNYWIDRLAQARIRAFSMRVGARLAAQGCFEVASEVLYLHRDEVRELIERPVDVRALVAERQAEHERQKTTPPPRQVGAPATKTNEPDRFDGQRFTSDDADLLLGTGASPGIVRGPARITLGPDDFGRIRSGDVIVCPSSNPSWVPVFTLAAGLVTNTGGILSHAAVVAREFGLPAVVGTGDATVRIVDGRMVEIDGTTGSVRLL